MTLIQARIPGDLLLQDLLRLPPGIRLAAAGTERTGRETGFGSTDLSLVLDIPDVPEGAIEVTWSYMRDNTYPDPVQMIGYQWRCADGTVIDQDIPAPPGPDPGPDPDPLDRLRDVPGTTDWRPSVPRRNVVLYTLSDHDARDINRRRADFAAYTAANPRSAVGRPGATGHIGHYGRPAERGQVFPAVITRAHRNGAVNLQVLLDGSDTLWATSRSEAAAGTWPAPGRWSCDGEPVRLPEIGDSVHYVSYGTPGGEFGRECRAAVISEIYWERTYQDGVECAPAIRDRESRLNLCVLNPSGIFFHSSTPQCAGETLASGPSGLCGGLYYPGGTWHWPA